MRRTRVSEAMLDLLRVCAAIAAMWAGLIVGASPSSADPGSGDDGAPRTAHAAQDQAGPAAVSRQRADSHRASNADVKLGRDGKPAGEATAKDADAATDASPSGSASPRTHLAHVVPGVKDDNTSRTSASYTSDVDTALGAMRPLKQRSLAKTTPAFVAATTGATPMRISMPAPARVAGATVKPMALAADGIFVAGQMNSEASSAIRNIFGSAQIRLAALTDQVPAATIAQPMQQITAAPATATLSAARPASIISLLGSVVFNVLGAVLQAFSGPPVLPRGSTVTVHTSTLTLDNGQTVPADWYFPENSDSSTRLIYLQHGFLATGPMYSYTAATLAEQTDSIVVVPTISSNLFDPTGNWLGGAPEAQAVADLFVGNREALTESASAAAGHPVTLPTKFVLVGHSLGADLVTGAAGDMVDNGAIDDLQGVVLFDGVDFNNTIPTALGKLSGANYRPVYDISSERYVWNRYGLVGDELSAARPGQFNGVMLVGGRHIDALQGGNPILQLGEYIVAGFSKPQNIEAVKILAVGWIDDMFAGTHDGIYGQPEQTISIPTSAGTATAVVLPFTSTRVVQATPWDGLANALLNFLFQYAVFDPSATTSVDRATPTMA